MVGSPSKWTDISIVCVWIFRNICSTCGLWWLRYFVTGTKTHNCSGLYLPTHGNGLHISVRITDDMLMILLTMILLRRQQEGGLGPGCVKIEWVIRETE